MTNDQAQALEALDVWFDGTSPRESSFFTLSGYAGVGKTWLIAHWLTLLLKRRPGLRVVVVAPTNKAVDVLRKKCGELEVVFRTLDSYLGFRIKRDDDWQMQKSRVEHKGGNEKADPDLVVCDEASMVKEEYHAELRHRRVPVLYVGDPAQLQPVGEDTSPAFKLPDQVCMTEVVRQQQGNPIIELATFLRDCIERGETFILPDVRRFVVPGDGRIAFTPMHNVHNWAEAALDKGMDCRILAFTNAAVHSHNAAMHERRFHGVPLFGAGELALVNEAFEYKPKDREEILLTNGELLRVRSCERDEPIAGVEVYRVRADFAHKEPLLVNGEPVQSEEPELDALVAKSPEQALSVHRAMTDAIYTARREGNFAEMDRLLGERKPLNKLAPLRHAYACTVHKSQGSTYDVALVDFSDVYRSKDMRARLMYVAATRPSQFLVLGHNA